MKTSKEIRDLLWSPPMRKWARSARKYGKPLMLMDPDGRPQPPVGNIWRVIDGVGNYTDRFRRIDTGGFPLISQRSIDRQ